jgi:uncharacterized protein YjbI with pentapeptide repeats
MTEREIFAYETVAHADPEPHDGTLGYPQALPQRLAAASPGERGRILIAALAAGETVALAGIDLRGIDLRPGRPSRRQAQWGPDVHPSRVVLDGADLRGALLSDGSLAGVSLRRANLEGALLVGADLSGADLVGANLRGANLTGARLARADLSYADLRGASLLTAVLSDATLVGTDLREALLQSSVMVRAGLRAADLRWARLAGANLHGADVRGARFEGAILNLVNFTAARLSASTDLGLSFLYHARFERTALSRRHLVGGIGEAHTDLGIARDTYRALARTFEAAGNAADARWAHRQASRMATATHRPDRAWRYYPTADPWRPTARSGAGAVRFAGARSAVFGLRHTAQWAAGGVFDLASGYGTCGARLLAALVATWLAFAAYFHVGGTIIRHDGAAAGWADALRYSIASLTPLDAYPLVATADGARTVATLEGIVGMFLMGALGYVAIARLRHE